MRKLNNFEKNRQTSLIKKLNVEAVRKIHNFFFFWGGRENLKEVEHFVASRKLSLDKKKSVEKQILVRTLHKKAAPSKVLIKKKEKKKE